MDASFFPGFVLAVLISGNVHLVNPVIAIGGSALFWSIVITGAIAFYRRIRRPGWAA